MVTRVSVLFTCGTTVAFENVIKYEFIIKNYEIQLYVLYSRVDNITQNRVESDVFINYNNVCAVEATTVLEGGE